MALNVETHFILPLIEFYGKEPTDTIREHINTELERSTVQDLQNGAQWLKNNRRSVNSFPSPKDCILAVTKGREIFHAPAPSAPTSGQEAYKQSSLAFVAKKGQCEMIEPDTQPWHAWQTYFRHRGCSVSLQTMMRIENKTFCHEKYAVPTQWPWEFDPLADRQIDRPEPKEEISEERRQAMIKGLKQLAADIRLNGVFKPMPGSKGAA